jgi:hypothetical protein
MSERIKPGATVPIIANVIDQLRNPLLDRTDIKVKIWRLYDQEFLDWSDMTFKPLGSVVRLLEPLAQVNRSALPGEYLLNFDTSIIVNPADDDTYEVMVVQDGATNARNLPQFNEIEVGQWVSEALEKPYQVYQSYSYDQTTGAIVGMAWVEHQNIIVLNPTSVFVSWYTADGTLVLTMTDSAPDARGFFKLDGSAILALNVSYYTVARVVIPDVDTIIGGKGIFTVG